MDESDDSNDPYARGFVMSRREVLRTSAVVGAGGALAGCSQQSGGDNETTQQPTETEPEPPEDQTETDTEPEQGGLTVVTTEVVRPSEGGRLLRVVLRNDSQQETMSLVSLTAEFFDPDLAFLGVQSATVAHFQPGERFEGYIPFLHETASAYAVDVTHSQRSQGRTQPEGLVVDSCLGDQQVRGTIENAGDQSVRRLDVRVTFSDDDGNRLGTGTDLTGGLDPGGETAFAVDFDAVVDPSTSVADYAVSVAEPGRDRLSVR